MIESSIQRLQFLCDIIPPLLAQITETDFSYKPLPDKWSKKEILGHLIDSATNNHQRFVRAQFENVPSIMYDQDSWNKYSYYNQMNSTHLISFWAVYNKHLLELIKRIPKDNYQKECKTGGSNTTIQDLAEDYVKHLEHHLKQITVY